MGKDEVLLSSSAGTERAIGGIFSHTQSFARLLGSEVTTGMCMSPAGDCLAYLSCVSSFDPDGSYLTVTDKQGLVLRRRLPEVTDPHGLAWHPAEGLLAVSTLSNSIVWLDENLVITKSWTPGGQGDCWHLNCVTWKGPVLCASAFGRFATHRGWVGGAAAGKGIVFEVESNKTLVDGLTFPHDPLWLDGGWLVCNSGTGEVWRTDENGKPTSKVNLNGWTRGVHVTDDRLFVGVTVHRSSPVTARARIAVLDRRSLKEVDSLPVPAKEIFSVVAVPTELVKALEAAQVHGRSSSARLLADWMPSWINWPKWTGRGWLHKRRVERYLGLRA